MRMKFSDIETKVGELHQEIWRDRMKHWNQNPPDPIRMLEPEIGAKVSRINFDYHEELGRFGYKKDKFEIAGMIDRQPDG